MQKKFEELMHYYIAITQSWPILLSIPFNTELLFKTNATQYIVLFMLMMSIY